MISKRRRITKVPSNSPPALPQKNIRRGFQQWKRYIDIDHSASCGRGDLKTKAATYLRPLIEWLRRRHSTRQRKRRKGRWEHTSLSFGWSKGATVRSIWYLESPIFLKARGLHARFPSLSPSLVLFARKNGSGGKLQENELSRGAAVSPAGFKGVGVFPRPLKYE